MCIGDFGVGGFRKFSGNHIDGFVVSLDTEGGDVGVRTFAEDVPCGVESRADWTAGWGRGARSFMLDATRNFGVPETAIPEFHDGGTLLWRDGGCMNVTLSIGEEVLFCLEPCGSVDAFDGGRVMSLG